MKILIRANTIFTPDVALKNHTIVIEGKKITAITSQNVTPGQNDFVINAQDFYVTPGLIDIHVHGALGSDTMDATTESFARMGVFFAQHGVTSFLPTTMTETREKTLSAIKKVATSSPPLDSAKWLGVHIEGPYFNPNHRGAQPEYNLRDAVPSEYEKWVETGAVKLVSIAPERKGALQFIDYGIPKGIEFSIGHTGATYEQVIEAANHGARQATHTFNGMLGLHHRKPGTVGGVLTDNRIYAQVIADGIHIHPAVVDLIIQAKGIQRTILITDAISATGLDNGKYKLGGEPIHVINGISRTENGGLAGSTLTLDKAIRNVMKFSDLSFEQVLPMATSVPAIAMHWQNTKGFLRPSADADITFFDNNFSVIMTMVAGNIIYSKEK